MGPSGVLEDRSSEEFQAQQFLQFCSPTEHLRGYSINTQPVRAGVGLYVTSFFVLFCAEVEVVLVCNFVVISTFCLVILVVLFLCNYVCFVIDILLIVIAVYHVYMYISLDEYWRNVCSVLMLSMLLS